jgi:hypothetical protein
LGRSKTLMVRTSFAYIITSPQSGLHNILIARFAVCAPLRRSILLLCVSHLTHQPISIHPAFRPRTPSGFLSNHRSPTMSNRSNRKSYTSPLLPYTSRLASAPVHPLANRRVLLPYLVPKPLSFAGLGNDRQLYKMEKTNGDTLKGEVRNVRLRAVLATATILLNILFSRIPLPPLTLSTTSTQESNHPPNHRSPLPYVVKPFQLQPSTPSCLHPRPMEKVFPPTTRDMPLLPPARPMVPLTNQHRLVLRQLPSPCRPAGGPAAMPGPLAWTD